MKEYIWIAPIDMKKGDEVRVTDNKIASIVRIEGDERIVIDINEKSYKYRGNGYILSIAKRSHETKIDITYLTPIYSNGAGVVVPNSEIEKLIEVLK
jgi:hypothetical protein